MKPSGALIHDFEKDLKYSELPVQYISYMKAIVHWWPETTDWTRVTDLMQQKKGKDLTITLPEEKTIRLQFKSRRTFYGEDLCIEYRHVFNDFSTKPGWIEVPSDADFLLYCVPRKIYRVDYKKLHTAWKENHKEWTAKYKIPPSQNDGYKTLNAAVPFGVLKKVGVEVSILSLDGSDNRPSTQWKEHGYH